ncbi:MAG: DUF2070 family protein [Thermoplasmata archaeon]
MDGEKYFLKLKNSIKNSPNMYVLLTILFAFLTIYEIIVRLNIFNFILFYVLPISIILIIDYVLFKLNRIYFPIQRTVFLEFVVFIIIYFIYLVFSIFFLKNVIISILFSYSSIPFFRFMFLKPFIDRKDSFIGLFSIYPSFLISFFIFFSDLNHFYILPFLFSSILFVVSSKFFIDYVSNEFKKKYQMDPVKYVGYFVNYLATRSINDMIYLNTFMINMYLYSNLKIEWISIEKGNEKYGIIYPQVHPGPFVEVGCSNLPMRLRKSLDFTDMFVFHTTVTNDQNCGGDEDIKRIAEVIKSNKSKSDFLYTTDFFRYSGDIEILVHGINDTLIVSLLPTKKGFDDVQIDIGNFISRYLKNNSYHKVFVVDAHNYFDENYEALKEIDKNILNRIKNDFRKFEKKRSKVGFSKINISNKSIGPEGISCISFSTDKHYAYVLIDGNNMVKGLRDEIIHEGHKYFDDVEVFTTDNHYCNYNPKDLNPVGSEDKESIIKGCIEAMRSAMKNEEEAKVSSFSKSVNIKVPGKNYMDRISKIVKNMVKKLKYSIIIIIMTFILVFLIFEYTFYFLG